jgi:non-ribosomal peptide synthase protein (TIGR01720 family)
VIRAREKGLLLKVRQVFEYQSIRELARHVQTLKPFAGEAACSGELKLSPIQQWFWSGAVPRPAHFHQSMLLQVPEGFTLEFLHTFIGAVHTRHDALRVRYRPEHGACRAWFEPLSAEMLERCLIHVMLSGTTPHARADEVEQHGALIKAGFDLLTGPLLKAVYFESNHGSDSRLLLIVHHLAMDGVSWRILLQDLATSFQQWKAGNPIRLSPRTTSYQRWTDVLHDYAGSIALRAERQYWVNQLSGWTDAHPAEADWSGYVTVRLNRDETQTLLSRSSAAYHTQIQELLLAALLLAVHRWTGQRSLGLQLESHGREDLFDDVDLSETLGWFTSVYPLSLNLGRLSGSGEAFLSALIKSVKEQVRSVPHHGLGYGVLRYLVRDEGLRQLEHQRQALILFNYMGQFDEHLGEEATFRRAPGKSGDDGAGVRARDYLLAFEGGVIGHCLEFGIRYSLSCRQASTVEQLARLYRAALCEMIEHCDASTEGVYSPTDFPLAHLDQGALDDVQEELLRHMDAAAALEKSR